LPDAAPPAKETYRLSPPHNDSLSYSIVRSTRTAIDRGSSEPDGLAVSPSTSDRTGSTRCFVTPPRRPSSLTRYRRHGRGVINMRELYAGL
jgi:hypothetical protein